MALSSYGNNDDFSTKMHTNSHSANMADAHPTKWAGFPFAMAATTHNAADLSTPTPTYPSLTTGKARADGTASNSNTFKGVSLADQFEQRMRMKLAKGKVEISSHGTNGRRTQEPSAEGTTNTQNILERGYDCGDDGDG